MDLKISIPDYDKEKGIQYDWVDGFEIDVQLEDNGILIIANRAGLQSLAYHLLNLAQEKVPSGHHLHFDEHNSLEEGSLDLAIQKKT